MGLPFRTNGQSNFNINYQIPSNFRETPHLRISLQYCRCSVKFRQLLAALFIQATSLYSYVLHKLLDTHVVLYVQKYVGC